MRVSDVLKSKGSSKVHTISPSATVTELLDKLAELNVGALVVSDDGTKLTGIVTERDIVRKLRGVDHPRDATVESIMTTEVSVCGPDDIFAALLSTMTDLRVRHIPVVADGELVGLLSIGDAVKFRMDQLEFERDQLNNYVSGN